VRRRRRKTLSRRARLPRQLQPALLHERTDTDAVRAAELTLQRGRAGAHAARELVDPQWQRRVVAQEIAHFAHAPVDRQAQRPQRGGRRIDRRQPLLRASLHHQVQRTRLQVHRQQRRRRRIEHALGQCAHRRRRAPAAAAGVAADEGVGGGCVEVCTAQHCSSHSRPRPMLIRRT
jgi:hypothetical protein